LIQPYYTTAERTIGDPLNLTWSELPRGDQGENPASIRMRIAGVSARRREGVARA